MILIKLAIIFFSYLILAHIFSIHTIIEGIDDTDDNNSPPDTTYQYQENTNVANNEQYDTSKQAGKISSLQETAKQLKNDIAQLKKSMRDVNSASDKNTAKLNSLESGQCDSSSTTTTVIPKK